MINQDTICAISTAAGNGAIAVIRLSGENAIDICDEVFVSPVIGKKLIKQKPNSVHYGSIMSGNKIIDDVLVAIFCAPHSYTGENTVEVSCHGSQYIQQQILKLFIENGVRMAQPGEFSMRAFMNGKMDLSQAEAVADLIASTNEASHQVALQQMRGGFSGEIAKLRAQLLNFSSLIELELDFSDEDVEFADRKQLSELIGKIDKIILKLVESFELGNAIKNGVPVAIVGQTNVGKSTLLNILLNEDRAIVSNIAGTTRDAIEDQVVINGISFRFIDTAGLRKTTDTIEKMGIERTYQKLNQASIVLLMVDANDNDIEEKLFDLKSKIKNPNTDIILVINKIDNLNESNIVFKIGSHIPYVTISAKHKQNIEQLVDLLLKKVNFSALENNDVIVTNARHYEALTKASKGIKRANEALLSGISGDFLAQDVREVLHYLGEITGEISTDEMLGNIFKNFCIGK